jgi:hypothetical protein
MWELWAYQSIGARTYLRSTYDRQGGNECADASHFLYQLADDCNVTLDVAGPASSTSRAATTGRAALCTTATAATAAPSV